jgi:hypothetical protein
MSEEVFNTTSSFPQDQGKNIRVSANIPAPRSCVNTWIHRETMFVICLSILIMSELKYIMGLIIVLFI